MYKLAVFFIFTIANINFGICEHNLNSESDSISNAQQHLISYLQEIDNKPSISIIGDFVSLEKTKDGNAEETSVNEDLFEKCARFLATRSLRIKFPNEEARSLVAEARKSKIRKILLPLLLILKLKAAIILPIVLSVIALVSFKGFGLGLAALAVAGTTALKNILEHAAGSKVSYEVVPTPIGHWSRSENYGSVEY